MISVVMATYNGEKYISDQLNSIAGQSIRPDELIITDDGSTDNTLLLVQKFARSNPCIKVRVVEGPRKGVSNNFLHGLSFASGDYVFLSDQDDIWLPSKIEKSIGAVTEAMEASSSEVALAITAATVVDANLHKLCDIHTDYPYKDDAGYLAGFLLSLKTAQGCSMCLSAGLVDLIGSLNYDSSAMPMYDRWIGIVAASCGEIRALSEPQILYRQHDENVVGASKPSLLKRIYNVLLKKADTEACKRQVHAFSNVPPLAIRPSSMETREELLGFVAGSIFERIPMLRAQWLNGIGILRRAKLMWNFPKMKTN